MPRLSILSVLVVGLPLIGCAQGPTTAQTAALPGADSQATPTGSHVRGAAADPFLCTAGQNAINQAPTDTTSQALTHSSCEPFLDINHR
jgi:hypothetical protein